MEKEIVFVLLDEFADWEAAFLAPALCSGVMPGRPGSYAAKYMSPDGESVRSIGGLRVTPDYDASTLPESCAGLILVGGMEEARDLALAMQAEGKGKVLDQFANGDNPEAHYRSTGPEIWRQTQGAVTHFISSMGTTGTIMGVSRYLKEQNPAVQIVGLQPQEGSAIPGIRRWPQEYLPSIFDASRVDRVLDISQAEAEDMMRRLAREEGIFCGVSSGGAVAAMLKLARETENAVMVAIICDRGDRYLSSGLFN